ncbi:MULTISPECIES: putative thiazole-containing bacteriocin maturation protein [unclassified Bacillus (in: firmicutes)]|uniref:putative thiazole-containing bacteriocin maturation protein n=1 Tax=unclassified Bacillus (in: firmicutes) TaxID=185979 RepID=UPI0008ED6524|nr:MULTISPECIES: putative thiazole-containing bacteriocin maturation protein [unclassified Bacillus (in: firmicutes)]SFA89448.1 putative thiazole-containing bacteriocin maturation protein [Bacillus sp. UNCCL13]SFQ84915.1 putative thiazole-containing bacteriocin maturation protein [Bacillus sp. cl95]
MEKLNPSMRLKVKRDMFFLPDENRGVYFRNNLSSFRMEGSMIEKWVEKLIPMFNGENTLEYLTNGLPEAYRDRVYEIAGTLYRNGFVKDVSQDRPHHLKEKILEKYASQIEFVDNLVDSGAYRFQEYRQSKVLAIGSGPFLVSLVSSLLESGLPNFKVLITETVPTNRKRLKELVAHARKTDAEVFVEEMVLKEDRASYWREIVKPFDSILYVSEGSDVEELRNLHVICKELKKVFLPSVCIEQMGMAGPLVRPDSDACWESAWRRMHQSVLSNHEPSSGFSPIAGAMLANLIVFDLYKDITGVKDREQKNQFFLLNLETMEGNWHSFLPHPLVTGLPSANLVEDFERLLERDSGNGESDKLLLYFNELTSKQTGIFHIWEEGDLKQLPLAQCRVQVVDPLSDGPTKLLQEIVITGLTHEEARREAGLTGIEAYVSRLVDILDTPVPFMTGAERIIQLREFVGLGAGKTFVESVYRGLQSCLADDLREEKANPKYTVSRVHLNTVEDERCNFYLQSLATMLEKPIVGLGKDVSGFPVVWIGTSDGWFGSVDLNITMALRRSLQQALFKLQNNENPFTSRALTVPSVLLDEKVTRSLDIPECKARIQTEILLDAIEVLERNGKKLAVYELGLEPFLKEEMAGVFAVCVRGEGLG